MFQNSRNLVHIKNCHYILPDRLDLQVGAADFAICRNLTHSGGLFGVPPEPIKRQQRNIDGSIKWCPRGGHNTHKSEEIVHMNRVAAEVLGTDRTESLGKRLWEIVRVEAVGDTIADVLRDAREHRREVRMTRDRRDTVLELIASPLKDANGDVSGAVLLLHDQEVLRLHAAVEHKAPMPELIQHPAQVYAPLLFQALPLQAPRLLPLLQELSP